METHYFIVRYYIHMKKQNGGLDIVWRPCEAHPRPERYGFHSDLCIQGFFFALEHGADIWEYHDRIYRAALIDRINIEDPEVIAGRVYSLPDHNAFQKRSIAVNTIMLCQTRTITHMNNPAFGQCRHIAWAVGNWIQLRMWVSQRRSLWLFWQSDTAVIDV